MCSTVLSTYMPHKAIWGISVTTIDNGVNPSAIPLARRPVENHDNPLTMLCVAHMSFWHGVDRLLRGMASYRASGSARPVRLLIAADTETLLLSSCADRETRTGEQRRVSCPSRGNPSIACSIQLISPLALLGCIALV